jgi:hypothetical protein
LVLAAACAPDAGPVATTPPPDAGPVATTPPPPDAGLIATTPAPDAGSAPQAELMDPDAVGIVAVSPDGNTALVNHRFGPVNAWDNDLWQVSRGQPPRQITASGNGWAYFNKDGSVFEYNAEDGLTHIARTSDGAVLPGVTTSPSLFWYLDEEPGEWLANFSIQDGRWVAERIHLPDFARKGVERRRLAGAGAAGRGRGPRVGQRLVPDLR